METKTLLEQFKDECQVIEFKYEYPGYVGYEQYGIITELSETELTEKYRDIIKEYIPYLVLDSTYKKARDEFRKNERKHAWRAANTFDFYNYEDGEMECHHPELIGEGLEEQFFNEERKLFVAKMLEKLTESQRNRIIKHFYQGLSIAEIARQESVEFNTVKESICSGLEKIKKYFQKHPQF